MKVWQRLTIGTKWMERQMYCAGWYLKLIYIFFIVQLQQTKTISLSALTRGWTLTKRNVLT